MLDHVEANANRIVRTGLEAVYGSGGDARWRRRGTHALVSEMVVPL